MTPKQRYDRDLADGKITPDPAQAQAIECLDALYHRLVNTTFRLKQRRWFTPWRTQTASKPVRGLYMWGGVGRGKTFLMDVFYDALPFADKQRLHFHRFMRQVHQSLRELQSVKNPLVEVAERIAKKTRVICFDEFFVTDITDAMLLAGLFESLFERGVTLVATSNIVPQELYKDGLQRSRFLPAIELICKHTEVINVDGGTDYRLRTLEQAELYHCPLDVGADESLLSSFRQLAPEEGEINTSIEIEGRQIAVRYLADDVVWFDFAAICGGPRSQNDYIEIAREFHAVLVSSVPQMSAANDDHARRFINMVDEFYDHNIKLVLSAAVPLDALYRDGRLNFEFARTRSRLKEMQSHEYLTLAHKA